MRCHYLRDGTVQTCFSLGWMEFFVPAGIILKALKDVSTLESTQEQYNTHYCGSGAGLEQMLFTQPHMLLLRYLIEKSSTKSWQERMQRQTAT